MFEMLKKSIPFIKPKYIVFSLLVNSTILYIFLTNTIINCQIINLLQWTVIEQSLLAIAMNYVEKIYLSLIILLIIVSILFTIKPEIIHNNNNKNNNLYLLKKYVTLIFCILNLFIYGPLCIISININPQNQEIIFINYCVLLIASIASIQYFIPKEIIKFYDGKKIIYHKKRKKIIKEFKDKNKSMFKKYHYSQYKTFENCCDKVLNDKLSELKYENQQNQWRWNKSKEYKYIENNMKLIAPKLLIISIINFLIICYPSNNKTILAIKNNIFWIYFVILLYIFKGKEVLNRIILVLLIMTFIRIFCIKYLQNNDDILIYFIGLLYIFKKSFKTKNKYILSIIFAIIIIINIESYLIYFCIDLYLPLIDLLLSILFITYELISIDRIYIKIDNISVKSCSSFNNFHQRNKIRLNLFLLSMKKLLLSLIIIPIIMKIVYNPLNVNYFYHLLIYKYINNIIKLGCNLISIMIFTDNSDPESPFIYHKNELNKHYDEDHIVNIY